MSDICYTVLIINVLQIASVNGKILSCKNFCVQKTNRIFCQTKHENLAFFVILFKQTKEYRNKEKQCRRADNHASQTPMPMEISPFAPAPVEKINGSMPKIITVAVITIGRKRKRAAASAAAVMERPFSRLSFTATSVSNIAVFANMPMSITRPVCMYMLFSMSNTEAKTKLPKSPKGITRRMANGMSKLS